MKRLNFRITFLLLSVVLMQASLVVAQDENASVRKNRVENGIAVMSQNDPSWMFDASDYSSAKKTTIAGRMKQLAIPGLSLAVIENSKLEWLGNYGILEKGKRNPVGEKTVFEAGSTSKLITTLLVLMLAEDGILDIDKDVNFYLKSWKIPESDLLKDKCITIRLLLTHQAGLNPPVRGFSFNPGEIPTITQILSGEKPSEIEPATIEYAPGSRHQYSNMGFLVLQQLLEDIGGKSFAVLAEEMLFIPLKMESSSFRHPLSEQQKSLWAKPHDNAGIAHDRALLPTAQAHGQLMTTSTDLARLAVELAKAYIGESRLISESIIRQLITKQADLDGRIHYGMSGQGLGVFLMGQGENVYLASPGYNAPGTICIFMISPRQGKGVVILTNSPMPNGFIMVSELVKALVCEYEWPYSDRATTGTE